MRIAIQSVGMSTYAESLSLQCLRVPCSCLKRISHNMTAEIKGGDEFITSHPPRGENHDYDRQPLDLRLTPPVNCEGKERWMRDLHIKTSRNDLIQCKNITDRTHSQCTHLLMQTLMPISERTTLFVTILVQKLYICRQCPS